MVPATLGPYTLLDRIGAGGRGEVYRARDARLDRTGALKLLPEGSGYDHEQLLRFQREARAASSLNHPHIISIFDAGEINGIAFIAMELGVLLFETLAGQHPFARPAQLDVLHAIVHDPPAEFAGASNELRWILGKALAKDRDERYQSMREFGADLRPGVARGPAGESDVVSGIGPLPRRPAALGRRTRAALRAPGAHGRSLAHGTHTRCEEVI